MDDNMIVELANQLEDLKKSGNLAGSERLATNIIEILRDNKISSDQKEQFVTMGKKLVTGERIANKNNYSNMIKKLTSLLNDYSDKNLDEENRKVAADLLKQLSNPNLSDKEKDVLFEKAESLLQIMKERRLLQQASDWLKGHNLASDDEMLKRLSEAMEKVEQATPDNKRNSITLLEDTLAQCYTVLEGSPPGK